jgi:hypothetical protein
MRAALLLALLAAALPAQADLYRWVDPQSGSVKFSSLPPPWLGDPEREARSPRVEVIGARPAGTTARAETPASARSATALEASWRALLRQLASLPQRPEFERSAEAIQQQLRAYEALRAELDRADPVGAARRRAEETTVMEQLRRGLSTLRP